MSDQPNGTAGMWLRMLGLDGLWETANSPGFQQQISTLVSAILETRVMIERVEAKLDQLTGRQTAFLPLGRSGNGPGAPSPASPVVDAGSGCTPSSDGESGGWVREISQDDSPSVPGLVGFRAN